MTVGEAARRRGVRRADVLELILRGRLRAEVLFHEVLVRRSELKRIEKPQRKPRSVASQTAPSAADSPAARRAARPASSKAPIFSSNSSGSGGFTT